MLIKKHITDFKAFSFTALFFLCFSFPLICQTTKTIRLNYSINIEEAKAIAQDSFLYQFSYQSDLLKPSKVIELDLDKPISIRALSEGIADTYDINFSIVPGRKVLFSAKKEVIGYRWITGFIYEKNSLEPLPEVSIYTTDQELLGVTDADGLYRVKLKKSAKSLLYAGISYKPSVLPIDSEISRKDVLLEINEQIIPITITSRQYDNLFSPKIELNFSDIDLSKGLLGDENPLQEVFSLSGVNSGNEGQTGIYVRGGTPDQNLILYNGVPLYEISHIAGLSSIFMNRNISSIDVYKSAIPAKYGGRLSSVLDIRSIRGDKLKYTGELSTSLSSIQANLDGPILKEKASFNISLRKSLLETYIDPLLDRFIDFEDLDIGYQDINVGMHFNLGDPGEITLFAYSGKDNIFLKTESGRNSDFSLTDATSIEWGTDLIGLNYKTFIGDKLFLKSGLSWSDYDFESRATYTFDDPVNPDTGSGVLDVVSLSSIEDKNAFLNLDVYLNNFIKLDLGGTIAFHEYNPAVQQSRVVLDESEIETIKGDSTISAIETTLYASAKIEINNNLYLQPGALFSSFSQDDTRYSNFQPRFSLVSRLSENFAYVISAGRTVQYNHLLQNSGTGLPSDLWVPSGANIAPQLADRLAVDLKYKYQKQFSFSASAFYRQTENAILYSGSNDLFYSIINDRIEQLIFREPRDWEEQIIRGQSFAQGLEFQLSYDVEKLSFFSAYTLSKVEMQFPDVNEGIRFPARHDRRHDITVNGRYFLNKNWSFLAQFVFGSGNAYSLAIEEIITLDGETILVNAERNAFRYPDFHHLDLYVDYRRSLKRGTLSINFGVYNIYNRLNPFYVYLFRDTVQDQVKLRQISVFPILPSFRMKYSF